MKSEIWYHATSEDRAELILADNSFKISSVKNGNFLGRGIYFGNDLNTVKKYLVISFFAVKLRWFTFL